MGGRDMTRVIYCEEKDLVPFMRPMNEKDIIRGVCPGCHATILFEASPETICWRCHGIIRINNLIAPDAAMSVGAGGQRMSMNFYKN